MKLLKPILAGLCLLNAHLSFSQNHTITHIWSETGGLFSDKFGAPTATDDQGNYYRSGFETNTNSGTDVKLQKLDEEGNLLWTTTLNAFSDNNQYEPTQLIAHNNAVYVTGILTYFTNNETEFFVAKTDDDGNLEWFVTDQSTGNDVSTDLFYDDVSDQLLICGTTERGGSYDVLVAAYDDNGVQQWLVYKDYNGNYDGGARIFRNVTNIAVHGSSQATTTQWDMVSWYFDEVGAFITEERVNGLTASNEQLKDGAIHNGYLHLCGSSTNSGGTDLKVVCLDANNNYLWSDTYNKNGLTEEGTVITTSNNAFVVAGYVTDPNVGENLLARKYSVNGSLLWHVEFDHEEENDRVLDVLEDAEGNYLLLAQVTRTGQSDVYLYALNGNTGALLWVEAIANDVNKNEKAQSIESNMDGQVYITYTINGIAATESYNYSELNYPRDAEPHSKSTLFIQNSGQVVDTDGLSAPDIRYSSMGLSPEYYFADNYMSTVVWDGYPDALDRDLQRIDYNFVRPNATHIGQMEEYERETHFNYYVNDNKYELQKTFEALAWPDLYNDIDAVVSSNSAGFKMTLVLESGADLNDIEIDINGASGFFLSHGDLHVQTLQNDIVWMQPYSYSQNGAIEDDDCITYDISSGNLKLSTPCELDFPYVIQLKAGPGSPYSSVPIGNLEWSTFWGGDHRDICTSVEVDPATGETFVAGDGFSNKFPGGAGIDGFTRPSRSGDQGMILKFNHDGEILWGTILVLSNFATTFEEVGIYDNIPLRPGKEVHVVGNYLGSFSAIIDDNQAVPSNAWQFNTPPDLSESEILLASYRNDDGTRLMRTAFGSPEVDVVNGMKITPSGLMYFYGETNGQNNFGSSATPPASWTFPVYNPGDGSYFESQAPLIQSGLPRPMRGFVSAMDLNTYQLAYSSFIRNDNGSSKSEFEAIYDMQFDGNKASYCGKGVAGARLGSFDPSQQKFATALDQTHSEFTTKLYFSSITHTPSGTVYIGMDDDGTTDPFISTPDWRNFQSASGKAFMMMMDGSSIVWDTYFGNNSNMEFYWHGTTSNANTTGIPLTFGKGLLAYSPSTSTFFAASTAGQNPVQVLDHPNFFFESENATINFTPANIQGDMHLNAFYTDGNLNLANHSWGTMFGGNAGPGGLSPFAGNGSDYVGDIETYTYNNKSYILVVGTSFSALGSTTNDDTKYPVADLGLPNSWFKADNYNTTGIHADFVISRFDITHIAQGTISTTEARQVNESIQLYPSPTSEKISITFKDENIENVEVYDLSGKKVMEFSYTHPQPAQLLDVATLPASLYTLLINNSQYAKFVKQ